MIATAGQPTPGFVDSAYVDWPRLPVSLGRSVWNWIERKWRLRKNRNEVKHSALMLKDAKEELESRGYQVCEGPSEATRPMWIAICQTMEGQPSSHLIVIRPGLHIHEFLVQGISFTFLKEPGSCVTIMEYPVYSAMAGDTKKIAQKVFRRGPPYLKLFETGGDHFERHILPNVYLDLHGRSGIYRRLCEMDMDTGGG